MKMNEREKIFADFLDKQNREWEFPVKRFKLGNTSYRPDFFLPKENLYVEVIGCETTYRRHAKNGTFDLFRATYPEVNFVVLDYLGNPYPIKKMNIKVNPHIDYLLNVTEEQYRDFKLAAKEKKISLRKFIILAVYELIEKGLK